MTMRLTCEVPIDPTEEMLLAGHREKFGNERTIIAIYKAMLAAAPAPGVSEERIREIAENHCIGNRGLIGNIEDAIREALTTPPTPSEAREESAAQSNLAEAHPPCTGASKPVVAAAPSALADLPTPAAQEVERLTERLRREYCHEKGSFLETVAAALEALQRARDDYRRICCMPADAAMSHALRRAESAESRVAELTAQLPERMKDCTIIFKECAKGHGWLTAKNWLDFMCPTCTQEDLTAQLSRAREGK